MKNKLYLIILIAGFVISCGEDYLSVAPKDKLSDVTFWKDKDDADLALVGCYSNWEQWWNILCFDGASDNAYDQHFGWKYLGNGQINSTTALSPITPSEYYYGKVRKYNTFLTNIDNVEMDESIKNKFKAEVRFLRAYDYFMKTMLFGDVPLVTEIVSPDVNLSRTPVAEVQQFILDELEEISSILPVENNIASGGHITSGAALALKARMELYMSKYSDAMTDAKKVIDMNVYELYDGGSPEGFRNMFLPGSDSDPEAILTVNYVNGSSISAIYYPQMLQTPTFGGFHSTAPTQSLVDEFETLSGKTINDPASGYDPNQPYKNRDGRLSMTVLCPGQMQANGKYFNPLDRYSPDGSLNIEYHTDGNAANTGYALRKYITPISIANMQQNAVNIKVIRLAEVYLTYAEAAVETNTNKAAALEYINKLRARGGLPAATELTRELVRRERRVELAFEGLRYFDVKRWDIGSTAMNGAKLGCREGSVDMNTGVITWGDENIMVDNMVFNSTRKYLLPIPQSEIDATGVTQNPGY